MNHPLFIWYAYYASVYEATASFWMKTFSLAWHYPKQRDSIAAEPHDAE